MKDSPIKEDFAARLVELREQRTNTESRAAALQQQLNQAMIDIQAIDGAMQECGFWLGEFEEEGTEEDSSLTPTPIQGEALHEGDAEAAAQAEGG